jgi:hypothetical protein
MRRTIRNEALKVIGPLCGDTPGQKFAQTELPLEDRRLIRRHQ